MGRPASLRQIDMKQEQVITQFLDRYLYSKLFDNHEVISDISLQFKGCDIAIQYANGIVYHDIKTQASKAYINNPLPTFAMEILFSSRDNREITGWFINDTLHTNVYCLVWINKATVNDYGYIESPEDIHEVHVMFVDKEVLKEYVHCFITDEELTNKARVMKRDGIKKEILTKGMSIVCSPHLNECPANLVISKSILGNFAESQYIVTQSRCTPINN